MSTFKVIVTEESPDVPGTGAFTASDSGGISGVGIGILVLMVAVCVVAVIAISRRHHAYNNSSSRGGFRISGKSGKIGGLFLILLIASTLMVPLMVGGQKMERVFADGGETDLTITTQDVELSLERTSTSGKADIYRTSVAVEESTQLGYKIDVYANTADLLSDDSNVHTKFAGLSGTGLTTLGENQWGISLADSASAEDKVWLAVPATKDSALTIVDKMGNSPDNDVTYFSYGANAGTDMETGTYSTTITFVATAYVETEQP